MSQHDMNIANADGATFRADLNSALQAMVENSSGATAPSTTFIFQWWADTTTGYMKVRNAANSAWIIVFQLATGGMIQGADIVAALALPVLADGNFNDVTGTTGITSINALGIGTIKWLQFDAIVTITHHATNLILPNASNIATVAGQILCFYEYASGDWRLISNSVPLSTIGGTNLVINGDMPIVQRGSTFATLTASQYTLDRMEWIDTGTTAAVITITQDTDVPTVAEAGVKFRNSLKIDVTTAEDIASGDAALYLSHKIEAQNVTFFGHGASGALSGTLSFWFKSTKTGIFTVNVDRDDATEKYSTEFTVGTTNTWEKHTVTIPGDTSGTAIANDNGIGLVLQFMMAVGATGKTSTKDAWNASGATELATSNQVNLLDNTANNVLITGIQYEVGSVASAFEQESISVGLEKARRYFWPIDIAAGGVLSSTQAQLAVSHPGMRVAPSLGLVAGEPLSVTDFITIFTQSSNSVIVKESNADGGRYQANNFTGLATGDAMMLVTSGGSILFSAEL